MNEALWALGRGTGVVALVMFTVTIVLGILGRSGRSVAGLGRFGAAAALELRRLGHKVTAIERDGFLAEKFLGRVSHVIHGDASDVGVIQDAKAGRFRIAVVAIGSSVEASVLAAANLSDAGVPDIWAKALSPEHARILDRIEAADYDVFTSRVRVPTWRKAATTARILVVGPPKRPDRNAAGPGRTPDHVTSDAH